MCVYVWLHCHCSDSAQLKDLAFVSVSKPKKSKGKKKAGAGAAQTPPGSPVEEMQPVASEEKVPEVAEPKRSLADMIKAAPPPQQKVRQCEVPAGVDRSPGSTADMLL